MRLVARSGLEHFVKSYLDLIVLSMLKEGPMHGYQLIAEIHNEFSLLLSPGTIYPLLYSLRDNGFLSSAEVKRKKEYALTSKGERKLFEIKRDYKKNYDILDIFLNK